jgi:O-antigen/teichoic acid export membrane protein
MTRASVLAATMARMNDERAGLGEVVSLAFPRSELRQRTVRGALVNALFLGGADALVLAQGLIVTVLLGPRAIGLYGIVTTTAVTVAALRRIGIDEAFVQQREDDQEAEFSRAFTLELIVGAAFSLVLLISAPIVSLVYGNGELLWLTAAVAYLPTAFALQAPTWIFFRRMDFVRVRLLQVLVPVVTFCVTVPLAALGVGVWSLVIGPAVGNTVAVIAGLAVSPYRLRLNFDREARTRYFRFSWPVFVAAASLLLVQQGQMLAFTLYGHLVAAGYITLAVTLTRYADRADQIIATTIYPAICVVRDQIPTLREIFTTSNRVALIWVLPFSAGFILFSPDLVHFVLGSKWEPAVLLLQGLAGTAAIQQLGYNWFSFYRARGDSSRQAVEAAVTTAAFLGLAVPALFLWGPWGFIGGRLAGALLVFVVRRHYVRALLGVELLTVAVRGVWPVGLAVLVVLGLRGLVWTGPRSLAQALGELVVFLVVCAVATWSAEHRLVRDLVGQVRRSASAGTPPAAADQPRAISTS